MSPAAAPAAMIAAGHPAAAQAAAPTHYNPPAHQAAVLVPNPGAAAVHQPPQEQATRARQVFLSPRLRPPPPAPCYAVGGSTGSGQPGPAPASPPLLIESLPPAFRKAP
eukprot:11860675-Alexandrium_andersonii.AAC.1